MQTKIFIGTRLTPELHTALSQTSLQRIPFEGKEYLGLYLERQTPTVANLQHARKQLIESLQQNLPDVFADKLRVVVFPQVLLG
ncbi:MAG: hypothetical protein S4CHLAM123_00100 [Chlamydiales bacterium]|nr:hypothetical protein [Chlamydiales bacterium]